MNRVAIIGTGIAGMSCASKLWQHFDLTIFEKNSYVGGHTNTVEIDESGVSIPVDTGFMVYNETTYPQLTHLFQELGVKTEPTSMSFSVQHIPSGLEFSGTGLSGLFAQRRNAFNPRHYRLLFEIHRFNTHCREVLETRDLQRLTLSEYCRLRHYSEDFQSRYLVPMSAAVWSSPPGRILDFPALSLVRFFTNHRFLALNGQLLWRTVTGGSQCYRDKLISPFAHCIRVMNGIRRVQQLGSRAEVEDENGKVQTFDSVVFACHADEAVRIIQNPTPLQSKLLSHFKYQRNIATLHTDKSVMPECPRAWASWNYRVDPKGSSTIYWMNSLQKVSTQKNYFVSINDPGNIRKTHTLKTIEYTHPLYTLETLDAQPSLSRLNQEGPLFFCGSYFNYGFHEDALVAGLSAADAVLSRRHEELI